MDPVELTPNLSNCIETVAKREYRKAMQQYLQEGENGELGERIETLRMFLESADFRRLRGESEKHLIQGDIVKFTLHLDEGQIKYEMIVE